ncbi:MAG: hypothetical protein RR234_03185, partial [Christensenella sp.]
IKEGGANNITWQDNSTFTGLTPNTKYTVYTKFIGAGFYNDVTSNGVEVTTEKSDISGSVDIRNTNPKFGDAITATATVTTANAGELTYYWQQSTAAQNNSYTVTTKDIGKPITVYVKAANCNGMLQASTNDVIKADGIAAPTNGVVNDAKGVNTFTFSTVSGAKYEYTTNNWQTETELTANSNTASIPVGNVNLAANALIVRAKETATHLASATLSNSKAFTESIDGSVTIIGNAEYGE